MTTKNRFYRAQGAIDCGGRTAIGWFASMRLLSRGKKISPEMQAILGLITADQYIGLTSTRGAGTRGVANK